MTFDATGEEVRHDGVIGESRPNDVVLNADGSLIYTAGADGNLRVYSADTGELVQTIDVGMQLGGIDISPDGSFLMAVESVPLALDIKDPWWENEITVTTYKVDLATGEVTSYPVVVTAENYTFHDVAIMGDGTALLSQNILPGWSGWASPKLLDLATGEYSNAGGSMSQSPVLSDSADGQYALLAPTNISDAPLFIYQGGVGIVASHQGYEDNVMGFNSGLQALNSNAGLVVQYVSGNGLHVYNLALDYQLNLFGAHPEWQSGNVSGLAFDSSGQYLFVLDNSTDTIVQLSTSDWSTVDTFAVGVDIPWLSGAGLGNQLIVGPGMRYFMVLTDRGLIQVDNPAVSATINGTTLDDDITGTGLFDEIIADSGNDTVYGLGGNDILAGGAGNDELNGDVGNDRLDGGAGNDALNGGAGSDTADYRAAGAAVTVDLTMAGAQNTGGAGTDTLTSVENVDGSAYSDAITGDANANRLTGGNGNDVITGNAGDDEINGGAGNDQLSGGEGADRASYFGSTAGVTVSLAIVGAQNTIGAGTDTLSSFTHLRGSNFADTLTGSDSSNEILGEGGDDTISGGGGNDTLNGGSGADAMSGGTGNDRYFVDSATDTVTEGSEEGVDEVRSTASFTLSVNVENLRLLGTGAINGTGNALANTIYGNEQVNVISALEGADVLAGYGGNDTLNGGAGDDSILGGIGDDFLIGGAGVDTLDGGSGNDVYVIYSAAEHAGETIVDGGSGGSDELRFATTAAATLVVTAAQTGFERIVIGTGTSGAAVTTGIAAINVDAAAIANAVTIIGNSGANILKSGELNDGLQGGSGDDRLYSNGGNDALDGGAGLDRMYGGAGNDTYTVDNLSDYVGENVDEGVDLVNSSVSHTLRANVENLTLLGDVSATGKGNALANVINGNSGTNGLYGYDGDDRLYGNAGNDRLDGGTGADRMYGGLGNDNYYVDSAGDILSELYGEGTDQVYASVNYTLRANFERVTLTGTSDLIGKGNELANVITGNAGANKLYGMDGNDTLIGAAGADILDGGLGNDMLSGGLDADKLYGGEGADVLKGDDGADWLEGGAARDRFYGGAGADTFVFRDGDLAGLTSSTSDQIHDFSQADGDRIRLSLIDSDATLAGDQAFSFVGTNAFSGTAGELRFEQIGGNTYVQGDTNGDGVADFWIRVDGLHTFVSGDFIL